MVMDSQGMIPIGYQPYSLHGIVVPLGVMISESIISGN